MSSTTMSFDRDASAASPTPAVDYAKPQQSSPAPKIHQLPGLVANPMSLLKAIPAAAFAFIDTLTALSSNRSTAFPYTSPTPVMRISPEPAASPVPYASRYVVFPNFRTIVPPLYTLLLRRASSSHSLGIHQLESSTTTDTSGSTGTAFLASGDSSTTNPAEPEELVSTESPQKGAAHPSTDFQYTITESDSTTSATEVLPSESQTLHPAVYDHTFTEKPTGHRPNKPILFVPSLTKSITKPHKFPILFRKADQSLTENEIPSTK